MRTFKKWTYEDFNVVHDNVFITTTISDFLFKLTIKNIRIENYGRYFCVGTNTFNDPVIAVGLLQIKSKLFKLEQ